MPRSHPHDPVVITPAASVAAAALRRVEAERFEARSAGVTSGPYVERLDRAIANARRRYVISAVTEIAALRAALGGATTG